MKLDKHLLRRLGWNFRSMIENIVLFDTTTIHQSHEVYMYLGKQYIFVWN